MILLHVVHGTTRAGTAVALSLIMLLLHPAGTRAQGMSGCPMGVLGAVGPDSHLLQPPLPFVGVSRGGRLSLLLTVTASLRQSPSTLKRLLLGPGATGGSAD